VYDLHGIGRWKLVITTADNMVFKTFTGTGEPLSIVWDGSDDTGLKTVNTGTTYNYTFYASDSVGNWGRSAVSNVKVLLREIVINLAADTLFDVGKADVKISVYKDLQKIADQIKGLGTPNVIVEGHTDNQPLRHGAYADNMELSQFRAKAVVKFFSELFDMDIKMFTPVGKGDTVPVASNDTPDGRQKNRRVTIRIQASKWE
jgi:flagellar motor protein MotB